MNLFTQKNILQKIIISILVVILLFEFIAPNISRANDDGPAGVLFTPVRKLVVGLGDSVMHIIGGLLSGKKGETVLHLKTEGHWAEFSDTYFSILRLGQTGLTELVYGEVANQIAQKVFKVKKEDAEKLSTFRRLKKNIKTIQEEGVVPEKLDIPMYLVTPEMIFADQVPFLNANIINPKKYPSYKDADGNVKDTPAMKFKSIVSTWYVALRNLAIIIMLSVLLYIGIRIIISSTANSKVKYKEMLVDWLIGMFLIFFMHYIMAFAFSMTELFTDSISASIERPTVALNLSKFESNAGEEGTQALKNLGGLTEDETLDWKNVEITTDFTGYARLLLQMQYSKASNDEKVTNDDISYMGYTVLFAVMVIYTVMFSWKYLKRLIYIIFLVMISPLIALSYPLDKMNDGSAQAFNMWIKEFIFTLLIQPFDLLLYTVLIGSAITMATDNMIYALVVLGFMLPAEKMLKKFFGFDRKAPIGESAMGGAVGGAIAMQAINGISKGVKNIKGIASKGGNGSSGGNNRIRTQEQPVAISDRKADQGADAEDAYMNEALGINGVQNVEVNNASDSANVDEARRQQLADLNDNSEETGARFEAPHSDEEWADMMGENYNIPTINAPKVNEEENINVPEVEGAENKNIRTVDIEIDDNSNKEGQKEEEKAFSKPRIMANKVWHGVQAVAPTIKEGAVGVAKGAATLTMAGAGATIGVAAGLASDDYTNVIKYGLAGAGAGGTIGKVGADKLTKVRSGVSNAYRKVSGGVNNIKSNYYKYEGKERYQEYLNKQSDKAFMKSKEVKEQYQKAFDKQYKEAMEKAMEYRKHGVTDNEVIIKAMKSKAKGVGKDYADSKRIAAAKLAKNVNNEKDVETIGNRLKDRGVSEAQIRQQKDMLRDIRGLF